MGLKTTDYEVKKLGITLPEAYAMVKDLTVQGMTGFANIIIQSSRENAHNVIEGKMDALEEVRIDFTVDRDANDRATAYETAKSQKEVQKMNYETHQMETVIVDMPFHGWEDDIVEEVTYV